MTIYNFKVVYFCNIIWNSNSATITALALTIAIWQQIDQSIQTSVGDFGNCTGTSADRLNCRGCKLLVRAWYIRLRHSIIYTQTQWQTNKDQKLHITYTSLVFVAAFVSNQLTRQILARRKSLSQFDLTINFEDNLMTNCKIVCKSGPRFL